MKASAGSSTAIWRPGSPSSWGWSPPDHFRLEGPSRRLDPRVHAYRADVADVHLAGSLFAPHYARAQRGTVSATSVMLRTAPDAKARAVSQMMMGETFETFDISGGWAWGRCRHDSYVGYLPSSALGGPHGATHIVRAAAAPVFAEPDIKAPVIATWPIATRFEGVAQDGFVQAGGGYVHTRHAMAIGDRESDPVAVAERLIGQPYLWGGRGGGGIDCSGLVQIALGLCGIAAPRDSDLQREALGEALGDEAPLRRGDLIFFPAHVGMMVDGDRLLHANGFWMAVTLEPLADVTRRLISAYPKPVLARKRLG